MPPCPRPRSLCSCTWRRAPSYARRRAGGFQLGASLEVDASLPSCASACCCVLWISVPKVYHVAKPGLYHCMQQCNRSGMYISFCVALLMNVNLIVDFFTVHVRKSCAFIVCGLGQRCSHKQTQLYSHIDPCFNLSNNLLQPCYFLTRSIACGAFMLQHLRSKGIPNMLLNEDEC